MHDTRAQQGDILESGTGPNYDVNGGDHIDFGLIGLKSGETVVKTHKTVYMNLGEFVFDRSVTDTCNFVFKESYMDNFNKIRAELSCERTGDYIENIYIPKDLYIINIFCDVMIGKKNYDKNGGSKAKRQTGGINSKENSKIISDVIIKPLYKIRKDLIEFRIIHKDKTEHIMVLIDFIEDIHNVLLVKWPITNPENILKTLNSLAR